jgi:hypothetical protein
MNLVTMKKSDSVVTKYATVKNQMHIMTLNNQMKKKNTRQQKHQVTEDKPVLKI